LLGLNYSGTQFPIKLTHNVRVLYKLLFSNKLDLNEASHYIKGSSKMCLPQTQEKT